MTIPRSSIGTTPRYKSILLQSGVHAYAAQEGDARLVARVEVNGFVTGGVQVFRNGGFGAVCDQEFGDEEATVACRQLGFESGRNLPFANIPRDDVLAEVPILNIYCLSVVHDSRWDQEWRCLLHNEGRQQYLTSQHPEFCAPPSRIVLSNRHLAHAMPHICHAGASK